MPLTDNSSSVNDISSKNGKIVSLELTPTTGISIKFAARDNYNPPPSSRYNYEIASLSTYSLNKWYWVYTTRQSTSMLTVKSQRAGIYDPATANFIVSISHGWDEQYSPADFSSSGFMVFVNGFRGYARGFCGKLRGIAVATGVSLSFTEAHDYLAQRQEGARLDSLLLYLPLNSQTGQLAVDYSSNRMDGTMGSSLGPDQNDPIWEHVSFILNLNR